MCGYLHGLRGQVCGYLRRGEGTGVWLPAWGRRVVELVLVHDLLLQFLFLPPELIQLVSETRPRVKGHPGECWDTHLPASTSAASALSGSAGFYFHLNVQNPFRPQTPAEGSQG